MQIQMGWAGMDPSTGSITMGRCDLSLGRCNSLIGLLNAWGLHLRCTSSGAPPPSTLGAYGVPAALMCVLMGLRGVRQRARQPRPDAARLPRPQAVHLNQAHWLPDQAVVRTYEPEAAPDAEPHSALRSAPDRYCAPG